jgi:antitoxin CptB
MGHLRFLGPSGKPMSEDSRLRWRCRRGMKELDLVLLRYLERTYARAPGEEQAAFRQVLEMQDPEILDYLTGRADAPEGALGRVVASLRTGPDPHAC